MKKKIKELQKSKSSHAYNSFIFNAIKYLFYEWLNHYKNSRYFLLGYPTKDFITTNDKRYQADNDKWYIFLSCVPKMLLSGQ